MSTRLYIKRHVRDGTLRSIEPLPGEPFKRTLFVTSSLFNTLYDMDGEGAERFGKLLADMHVFVKGQHITMSFEPFKHKRAFMGLLYKPEFGIWDIRSRSPAPGLRIFGGFALKNTFVALSWRPRSVSFLGVEALADTQSGEWDIEINKTRKAWKRLFRDALPLVAKDPSELVLENATIG